MNPHITPVFNNQSINQNIIQLEFKQAMKDFKEMFPTLDLDVIEMVLRQNQGAVDSSINQLLEISNNEVSKQFNDSFHKKNELKKNLNLNTIPKEKIQKSTFNQLDLLSSNDRSNTSYIRNPSSLPNSYLNKLREKSRWNPPLIGPLPDDFLRLESQNLNNQSYQQHIPTSQRHQINNFFQNHRLNSLDIPNSNDVFRKNQTSSDHLNHYILQQKLKENERQRSQLSSNFEDNEAAKYLEDERIAIMLQNEEFVSDLRRNKEFMTALNYDSLIASNNQAKVKGFHNENYNGSTSNGHSYNFENNQNFSDADFKEHLRNMGKISRKKFAQLAGLFTRRKSNLPSRDNLLLNSDDQYTQLENDYSDNEDSNRNRMKNSHTKN